MAKQRDNAHYQRGEVTIRYSFHPRCGEAVIAAGCKRYGDEVALIIRQPDGTLTQLPLWMTEDRAAEMTVAEIPRLSLPCLRELRLELDAWQSLVHDDSRREGDEHATFAANHRHPDLFASHEPPAPTAASERTKLLALVSALLAETLAVAAAEASDEDHA